MKNVFTFSALSFVLASCANEKPMNVIFIMSDDHTSTAIGSYSSLLSDLNPTPNIDALASDGTVFDNCFCTNSISTPSRACIISGQYSHHNGVLTLNDSLDVDKQYLAKEFKELGYQTAMVGKWHLKNEPVEFDYYKVLNGQGKYFDTDFITNESGNKKWPKNIVKSKGHSSDVITDITLNWLKNIRDKNKPFFIMHHYKAPHDMFEYAQRYEDYLEKVEIPVPESLFNRKEWGSEATRGKKDSLVHFIGTSISARHKRGGYVAKFGIDSGESRKDTYLAYQKYLKDYLRCVKGVDDNLKRLFDYLKDEGLWDNTIIVYTGDQGMMLGEHDLIDKRWMYEESLRMPLIIRDPRQKEKGKHCKLIVNNIDFAPTLIEMAGGKAPKYMDGRSFASIFKDQVPENWKKESYYRYWMHMYHHYVPSHIGIRTDKYKLILYYGRYYDEDVMYNPENKKPKNKRLKQIVQTPVAFELYDIENDPKEMVNVVDKQEYQDVFNELRIRLYNLRQQTGDTDDKYPILKEIIDKALSGDI